MRAIFLDRDGTINAGIPKYERVDSVDKVELLPGVMEGLTVLAKLNYGVFLVTNQLGLAEGLITPEEFDTINARTLELIAPSGIKILQTYFCPHGVQSDCLCQKPKPGMLLDAAKKYDINLAESWMVGDRLTDVQTGISAGTRTVLVLSGAKVVAPDATYTAQNLLDAANFITSQS